MPRRKRRREAYPVPRASSTDREIRRVGRDPNDGTAQSARLNVTGGGHYGPEPARSTFAVDRWAHEAPLGGGKGATLPIGVASAADCDPATCTIHQHAQDARNQGKGFMHIDAPEVEMPTEEDLAETMQRHEFAATNLWKPKPRDLPVYRDNLMKAWSPGHVFHMLAPRLRQASFGTQQFAPEWEVETAGTPRCGLWAPRCASS